MRKEPFTVNDYVHVYNRGNRKLPIVRDDKDRRYFVYALYYFNTEVTPENPFANLKPLLLKSDFNNLRWPDDWQPRDHIVKILAFTLMENHFHLLLKEIKERGVTKFMQRFGTGMTNRFNTRYQEVGRLFQGAYKAKRVKTDAQFRLLSVYIQVKNVFEMYPGGLKAARADFNRAFKWAEQYPFSSLYLSVHSKKGKNGAAIIDTDLLGELFGSHQEFRAFASECLAGGDFEKSLGDLVFEE